MPPKSYFKSPGVYTIPLDFSSLYPKAIKISFKVGTRVLIESPVKMTFETKTSNVKLSVAMAINEGRRIYCDYDWSKVHYVTEHFPYQEQQSVK